MIRIRNVYPGTTKEEIKAFLKKRDAKVVDFRVPHEGDIYLAAPYGNSLYPTNGIWGYPRLIVEYLPK